MTIPPPKILILDNDETTGSYYILFSVYDFLRASTLGRNLNAKKTLQVLINYFEKYNVFRPGLRQFLQGVSELKQAGKIDKVCIYTNQLDVRNTDEAPWMSSNSRTWSVPELIAEMFCIMTDNPKLIDEIFTRPIGNDVPKIDDYPVKDLVRVYNRLFPNIPVNFSATLFIDDLHNPKYIVDSSNSKTDSKTRIKISQYFRHQSNGLLIDIINEILRVNGISRLGQQDTVLLNYVDNGWLEINDEIKTKNKGSKLPSIFKRVKKFFESTQSKHKISKHKTEKNVKGTKNKRGTIKRRYSSPKTAKGGRC